MLLFSLHIKISYEGIDVQYYPHGWEEAKKPLKESSFELFTHNLPL